MGLIDWSSVSLISDQTYWWYLITSIKAKVLAVCESCSLRLGCMVTQKAKHSSQEWIIRLFKQFSPSFYTNKDYMENIHTYTLVPANSHEVQTWNAQRNCNKHKSNMLRTLKAWDSKWNVKVHSSKIRKRLNKYRLFGRVVSRKQLLSKNNMVAQCRVAKLYLNKSQVL